MTIYIFRFRLQIYTFFSVIASFQDFFCCFEGCFQELFRHFRGKKQELFLFWGHEKAPCMTCILSDTEAQRVFMYSIPDSDLSPVHDLINIFSVPILGRFLWFSVPILGIMTSSQPLFVRHCLFRKTLNYSFFPTFLLLFLHNWKISCIFALEII